MFPQESRRRKRKDRRQLKARGNTARDRDAYGETNQVDSILFGREDNRLLNRRFFVGSLTTAVSGILPSLSLAQGKGTAAIIIPSHDNPFFKTGADSAAAKAAELG
ncbi:MAG: hypothetical protein ACK47C_06775 [Paracoccaceae bacterium]